MVKTASKKTSANGANPKPRLGQNFLVDPSAARRIVEALGDISTLADPAVVSELVENRVG